MKVNDKLKLNKFRFVSIPKNADYFARLGGARPVAPNGAYSGETCISNNLSKVEQLYEAEKMNLNAIRQEAAENRNKAQETEK